MPEQKAQQKREVVIESVVRGSSYGPWQIVEIVTQRRVLLSEPELSAFIRSQEPTSLEETWAAAVQKRDQLVGELREQGT